MLTNNGGHHLVALVERLVQQQLCSHIILTEVRCADLYSGHLILHIQLLLQERQRFIRYELLTHSDLFSCNELRHCAPNINKNLLQQTRLYQVTAALTILSCYGGCVKDGGENKSA